MILEYAAQMMVFKIIWFLTDLVFFVKNCKEKNQVTYDKNKRFYNFYVPSSLELCCSFFIIIIRKIIHSVCIPTDY